MKAYRIKIIGTQHSRQIQEMHLVCYLHFDDEKCTRPEPKIKELENELAAIVQRYFDSPDYVGHKEIFSLSKPD